MGLFSNKKKLCPICGNPTPRLLPTKVEGQPICKECSSKALEMQGGSSTASEMTIEAFREYLGFYDENALLRSTFKESYQRAFGFLGGAISLDASHRLLRFNVTDSAMVFEASSIRCFRILEDAAPLFEGTKDALLCFQSAIPARVRDMGPEISRYMMEQKQYEQMKHMDEILKKRAKETGESYSPEYYSAPDVNSLKPFQRFYIQIDLDHPYWSRQEYDQGAPGFFSDEPSITHYLREYEERVEELHEVAVQLMAVLNPDAPERQADGQTAIPSAPVDTVGEIQKYKALLDDGVITEEEFTAKKRQLLGI